MLGFLICLMLRGMTGAHLYKKKDILVNSDCMFMHIDDLAILLKR
jgi:hypothetical protein